ncbi:hypothetical protein V5O48_002444 [Marasmius crinis-equi]|uniref:F-box domain-containing protein n=1 Tax=Marasmius crinis-equi TaxID=585013 RepID=A0ABR3FVN2_9AGAR
MTSMQPRPKRTAPDSSNGLTSSLSTYPFPPPPSPSKRRKNQHHNGSWRGWTDLPLELILETFALLDMPELLALIRVNRLFRSILTSKIAESIWTDEMKRLKCPPIPSSMGVFEFVGLLLRRETRCQQCGGRGLIEPTYIIRKQLCRRCFRNRFTTESSAKAALGSIRAHPRVLELVPSMRGDDGLLRYSVDYLVEVLGFMKKGYPRDLLRAQYFEVVKFSADCTAWRTQWDAKKASDAVDRRRLNIAFNLYELGFNPLDFEAIGDHPLVNTQGKLHNRDWVDHIFPQLVPLIARSRIVRMFRGKALDVAMKRRLHDFGIFYSTMRECVSVQLRRTLPNAQAVSLLPICRDRIIQPDKVVVTGETFEERAGYILQDIRAWLETQLKVFQGLVAEQIPDLERISKSYKLKSPSVWPVGDQSLELAIGYYICAQCQHPCITAREAIAHINNQITCKPSTELNPTQAFHYQPSPTVFSLLRLCGLPADTTTDHLDQLNLVFHCVTCVTSPYYGDWRGCVEHGFYHHGPPKYERASRRDLVPDRYIPRRWSCSHCGLHSGIGETRERVERHVQNL